MTIKQMTEMFATVNARTLCWEALIKLSYLRYEAKRKTNRFQQVSVTLSVVSKFKLIWYKD
jgi:hypothetical protein